jgi:hypothetical protein
MHKLSPRLGKRIGHKPEFKLRFVILEKSSGERNRGPPPPGHTGLACPVFTRVANWVWPTKV